MKSLIITGLLATLAVPAAFAQTGSGKIAVIAVPRVLSESNLGKKALEGLRKMQEERTGRLKKLDDELKTLNTELTQKRMSLSADKVADLEKRFNEKKISLQRLAQDAERELEEARNRSLQELEKQILPVITQIGKETGVSAIFNKFESGLVYASDAVDITDMVIKRFNDATGAAAAAPPAKK